MHSNWRYRLVRWSRSHTRRGNDYPTGLGSGNAHIVRVKTSTAHLPDLLRRAAARKSGSSTAHYLTIKVSDDGSARCSLHCLVRPHITFRIICRQSMPAHNAEPIRIPANILPKPRAGCGWKTLAFTTTVFPHTSPYLWRSGPFCIDA